MTEEDNGLGWIIEDDDDDEVEIQPTPEPSGTLRIDPSKVEELAKLSVLPDKVREQAGVARLNIKVEELEKKILGTNDEDERSALVKEYEQTKYQIETTAPRVPFRNLSDAEIQDKIDRAQMDIERAALNVSKLVKEGFEKESITVRKAEEAHVSLIAARQKIDQELRTRKMDAVLNQRIEKEVHDRVARRYKAEAEKELQSLRENPATESWVLEQAQAVVNRTPASYPDYNDRLNATLKEVRAETDERIIGRQGYASALLHDIEIRKAVEPKIQQIGPDKPGHRRVG